MAEQNYFFSFVFLSCVSLCTSTTTYHNVINPSTGFPTNPTTTLPATTFPPVTITPTNPVTTVPSTLTPPVTNPVSQYPPTQPSGTVPVPVVPPPVVSTSPSVPGQSWCVAKAGASQTSLQLALDYACGIGGADCSQIQQGGNCYSPITLQNHASFAFNSYYQKNPSPQSCDFGGAASVVRTNPSTGSCIYQIVSSTSTSTPTPIGTTTPTPSTQTVNQLPATSTPTQIGTTTPSPSTQTVNQLPATSTPTQIGTTPPTPSTQTVNQLPATPIIPTGGGILGAPPAIFNPENPVSNTLTNPSSGGQAVNGFDGSPNGNNPTSSDCTHFEFHFGHVMVATLFLQAVIFH